MTVSPDSDDERLARVGLSRVVEPGDPRVGRLVARTSAREVWQALCANDLRVKGVDGYRLRLADADPVADLDRAARAGIRVVIPGDPEWPVALEAFESKRPLLLWVRGDVPLDEMTKRMVAVVGARASTDYGDYVSAELGASLADRGWTVVSGGAYGIDARAHQGALAAGGATVAVLACGLDVPYPRGHERLFDEVAAHGALVGELPPGCTPTRYRFLERNRVIAGLADGVVVVEAALRSGATNTARWAERLGRHVMAVPGPVTSSTSAGCHTLLRSHTAECVTCAAEVVEIVGRIGADAAPVPRGGDRPRDTLPADATRVLEAIPARGACTTDTLVRQAGLEARRVLGLLGELQASGWVDRADDGWCLGETALSSARRDTPGGGA